MSIEARLQRLEDIQEIEHLQKRYQFYFGMMDDVDEIMGCFSKDPYVSCEISDRGADIGFDKIKESFDHKWKVSRAIPGVMSHLLALQSVVEIDEGGNTATGLWIGFGPLSAPIADNEVAAMWNWGKYDMKYIKEDGKWKIFNLHFALIFRTPFDQGWVKEPEANNALVAVNLDEVQNPHKPYNPKVVNKFPPGPPEPAKDKK